MDTTDPGIFGPLDAGDSGAWRHFDAIYRPMILRIARRLGLNKDDAQDVAQECMQAILSGLKKFDYDPKKGRFRAWLQTLVKRRVLNFLRKRQPVLAGSSFLGRVEGREPSAEKLIDDLFRREQVRYCLNLVRKEIEPETYAAFLAHVYRGQPVTEVCAALDMTPGQVHGIKCRVLKMIRKCQRTHFGEDLP
jgi:RNA polymerase sigma-70 factor (ECF subfamily)